MFDPKPPFYSLCLITYNQERYIADAVQGALKQTYSPTEIVISDDYSTDNTFNIVNDIVKEYKGPHKIILNRNKSNLGIAGNRNVAFSLAGGDWIISQDCDDISLPDRIKIIDEAKGKCEGVSLVATAYYSINEEGTIVAPVSPDLKSKKLFLTGATFAYRRDIYDIFGNLGPGCLDDVVLLFRALLLGKALVIDVPTVLNRESHDFIGYLKKELGYWEDIKRSYNQRSADLESIRPSLEEKAYRAMKTHNDRHIEKVNSAVFDVAYRRKKEVVNIYTEKSIAKTMDAICVSRSFTFLEKIKLFCLSFKYVRIARQHMLNARLRRKSFTGDKLLFGVDDLVRNKMKLATINDI